MYPSGGRKSKRRDETTAISKEIRARVAIRSYRTSTRVELTLLTGSWKAPQLIGDGEEGRQR